MFHPQPPVAQRRHRRLPSGTMVSYAEVKSYLSKREIPQLFESLMAGLMYHRPENHIGYLQSCLDEVKTNNETKIHWSTFVNKKRKSKEILPPLTPKKQDSFNSSWSDNSRQSTPLPPISAKTVRTRGSPDQQQDLRNTYILYHNPPPILAKPKVPVISVLGGLGSKIDELCEKAVSRLRGVVHISTCSMLKTRMTIEGFYRVTSIPACAVVDSVLQAMSMVQSSTALIVAGFPRNRGDIEEYRSRRVRMDGVVLVDFEEEALRRFLKQEVSIGTLRVSDIENELEKYKQDIISVAEYYDEKELLTVVVGDQDVDEMVEDIIIAVDKIIETRKDILDDDSVLSNERSHECEMDGPCKALLPSPEAIERPSTVEIRDATEEDIKAIEAEAKNSAKISAKDDVQTLIEDTSNATEVNESSKASVINADQTNLRNATEISSSDEKASSTEYKRDHNQKIPLLFAFENISTDSENLKDFIVSEKGMCFIDFNELVRNDDDSNDGFSTSDKINILKTVLQKDSVSYSSGFFVSGFPFSLLKENRIEDILKLGDPTFICKIKEKRDEKDSDDEISQEDLLFKSPLSDGIKIIFVTESNLIEEVQSFLQELTVDNKSNQLSNEFPANEDLKSKQNSNAQETTIDVSQNASPEKVEEKDESIKNNESPQSDFEETGKNEVLQLQSNKEVLDPNFGLEDINRNSENDSSSRDDNEDSTCKDVEDLITDDTLLDGARSSDILDNNKQEASKNTLSDASMDKSSSAETLREKAVLARQDHLEIDSESISNASDNHIKRETTMEKESDMITRNKLTRQATFSSGQEPPTSSGSAQLPELVMQIVKNPSQLTEMNNASETKVANESEKDETENKSKIVSENSHSETLDKPETEEMNQDKILSPSNADSDLEHSNTDSFKDSERNEASDGRESKEENSVVSEKTTEGLNVNETNDSADIQKPVEGFKDVISNETRMSDNETENTNKNCTEKENLEKEVMVEIINVWPKPDKPNEVTETENSNIDSIEKETQQKKVVSEIINEWPKPDADEINVSTEDVGSIKADVDSIEKEKLEKEVLSEIINVWPKPDTDKIKEEKKTDVGSAEKEKTEVLSEIINDWPKSDTEKSKEATEVENTDKDSIEKDNLEKDVVSEIINDWPKSDTDKSKEAENTDKDSIEKDNLEIDVVSEIINDWPKPDSNNIIETTETEKSDANSIEKEKLEKEVLSEIINVWPKPDNDKMEAKNSVEVNTDIKDENNLNSETESVKIVEEENNENSELKTDDENSNTENEDEVKSEADTVIEEDSVKENDDALKSDTENDQEKNSMEDKDEKLKSETDDVKGNSGGENDENLNPEAESDENLNPEAESDAKENSANESDEGSKHEAQQVVEGKSDGETSLANVSDAVDSSNENDKEEEIISKESDDTKNGEDASNHESQMGDSNENNNQKDAGNEESSENEGPQDSVDENSNETNDREEKDNDENQVKSKEQLENTSENAEKSANSDNQSQNGVASETKIYKSVDNDSDSNDEKSITIETKAEVHATDCLSPPLDQPSDSENQSVQKAPNADAAELSDTALEELNNLNNERYSGKYQERNGSGILGNSRQEDHHDAEEPQERSSSSSRGEL